MSRPSVLVEGGSKTIDASVAVKEERAGVVGDRVPVRVDQNRRGREFLEERPYDSLHLPIVSMGGVKTNFAPCFRSEVMDRTLLAMSARNFL